LDNEAANHNQLTVKHLKFITVLILFFTVATGCRNVFQMERDATAIEISIDNLSDSSLVEGVDSRMQIVLRHPTMDMRIGYPAIIAPGEEFPSVKVSSIEAGKLQVRIFSKENGVIIHEVPPVLLDAGDSTTITFPGTPDKGRYSIRIDLIKDKKLIFRDAWYFTVMDVGQLPDDYSVAVHPGENGRLVYTPDFRGNRIPDFSMVGYRNGMDIPNVPVKLVLEPKHGDDTERIQAAINAVSDMPLDVEGFRGAVLLKKGVYEIGGTLNISASGVVLRGEGQGDFKEFWLDPAKGHTFDELKKSLSDKEATILIATGRDRRWVIRVEGKGGPVGDMATATEILDNYVPVGANSFTVTSPENFSVGDSIIVERKGNARWISEIGMDSIPERPDGGNINQWSPLKLEFEHVITEIEGNRITINSSIVNAIEKQWGGGRIYRYSDPGRITRSGVENLRAISFWKKNEDGVDDTRHPDRFLALDNIRDGWVRNITLEHFYGISAFLAGRNSLGITFQNSSSLVAAPEFYAGTGYDRTGRTFYETGVYVGRYGFHFAGQNGLVMDSYALHNRHAFVVSAWVTGPNVFLNSHADKSLTWSEPHHRWSVGGLYDNIRDMIGIMNRLSYGTGHGWAGANYVAWNTEGILATEQPPTAQNWAVGHVGEHRDGPFHSWNMSMFGSSHGYWESHGARVKPASLYLKQLEDRLSGIDGILPDFGGYSESDNR
jgi:hypothetical protein